jgi:hypothetical protein
MISGQSLAHADKVLVNLKTQVKQLDRELKTLLRSSAAQNPDEDKEIEQEILQVKLAMEVLCQCLLSHKKEIKFSLLITGNGAENPHDQGKGQ